ncbi:MAG: hypothetical protein WCK77_17475 [Verrucomicrobiota bacterium]
MLSKETRYADGMTNNRAYAGRHPMVSSSLRNPLIYLTVAPCLDAAGPLGEAAGTVAFSAWVNLRADRLAVGEEAKVVLRRHIEHRTLNSQA